MAFAVASKRLTRTSTARAAAAAARQRTSCHRASIVPPTPAASSGLGAVAGRRHTANISAPLAPPPFPTVVIYNQSKHATQSVLADIRAVWGKNIRVIQTLEDGKQRLPNMDGALYVRPKSWGDLKHFEERLNYMCTQDHALNADRNAGKICFMPGWSAFAESAEAAVAVQALGLVWPGTEPVASQTLEKIGFKRICASVGAPTPPFVVLAEEELKVNLNDPDAKEKCIQDFMKAVAGMNTSEKGLIKSIHGGGGKGTAHLDRPDDPDSVRASVEQVLNEMGRADGIYFEEKVNTKGDGRFYQLELEVDGDICADGGRFVWFNSRLQKVVEIGLSDEHVPLFMPKDLYEKSRVWASEVARQANNNTRATMEALVFQNEKGEFEVQFIECNRRPQVENEALALLQQDSAGNRRYTFAELMMRAKGYAPPVFEPSAKDCQVVLHARWLHGNPDSNGNITYQAGNILGMTGPRLDYLPAELMAPGEISFTSDPQLGKAVITASSWEEMCDRAANYFKLRRPTCQGAGSTYAQTMYNLFTHPDFRAGKTASNETFKKLDIPEYPSRGVLNILQDQVAPVLVSGYRPGEGVDKDRWPTPTVVKAVDELHTELGKEQPRENQYTKFSRGEDSYESYVKALRNQLSNQGGGWVTVGPRDTAQQGNDSESASLSSISRRNSEIWAERAGCVGYETGGAQYQAGLIRGFDPAMILTLGLPYNMPSHSLQRSQYVNGLTELPTSVRQPLFHATAELVSNHYRPGQTVGDKWVPWQPYNFHAGNYCSTDGYSPQDETTAELLKAKCIPMPNWVFSAQFPLKALEAWTGRQIDVFSAAGLTLHQIRIKNPGQGKDWTPEAIWTHIKTMDKVFKARNMESPIVYLHNHDFNGQGGHIGAAVFKLAHAEGFTSLVIDSAYRKNGTHNDNTVLTAPLNFTQEQSEALIEYNYNQQALEAMLSRFDSRNSQMTPWDSDWAGGTEGSDIRIAKEFGINPRHINLAKEVASEVFPLERAVTPFSEYKLRLGLGLMIEDGIAPKTVEQVRKWVNGGGKLKVGGDVLVGLKRWETLVPKTPEVDKLLSNMPDELNAALGQGAKLITPEDLPANASAAQVHNALGYQQKGFDFAASQAKGTDLSPLLVAPHVLHHQPRTLPKGTEFELLVDPASSTERAQIQFQGFGTAPNKDLTMSFLWEGQTVTMTLPDPDAAVVATADSGPRKATPGNKYEFPTVVPGEILTYSVNVGDVLKAGEPLVVLESMKMEMKISVPDELDGLKVKSLPCKGRTKEKQGDLLAPGDLMLELEDA